jgi:hypothetical protein
MRTSLFLVLVAATLVHAADDETARFLGAEADRPYARLRLQDAHPLWGGVDVSVCASGSACVRIVDKTQDERRFLFTIPEKDARAIFDAAAPRPRECARPDSRRLPLGER